MERKTFAENMNGLSQRYGIGIVFSDMLTMIICGFSMQKQEELLFQTIKPYKKGTMHFKFQSIKIWEDFNRKVGEIKGWQLPRKTDTKTKGTERTKSTQMEVFEF
jgi:hypothetical protein